MKVGSSLVEIFENFKSKIQNSDILNELGLKEKDYIVISLHREENVDNPRNFDNFLKSLSDIQKYYSKKIIISTHPMARKN